MKIKVLISVIILCIFGASLAAQEPQEEKSGLDFGLNLEIGAQVFNELDENDNPVQVAYQMLILKPEIIYGKFGLGLYIPLHFRFLENDFDFRDEDWVVQDGENAADKYLPMFQYIRYGHKGDPVFAKLGSIDNATLGNGFIMGNYANTRFLPEKRIFGASLDVDGQAFSFPYIGMETFVGNLSAFDVIGGRMFVRPIYMLDVPVVKNLQVGVTYAMDRIPDYHFDFFDDPSTVSMWGVDFKQPVVANDAISLALYGDLVYQKSHRGIMVGTGGRFVKIVPWSVQLRFLGDNFVPEYFDSTYDLYREWKYSIYEGSFTIDGYNCWYASTGLSLLGDTVVFNAGMQGVLGEPEYDYQYPQLNAALIVKEGVLPGFFFDASYEKKIIKDYDDLVSPENAVIGARINYRAGTAVITLGYNLRYNPDPGIGEDEWETTTTLSTSVSF